MRWQIFRSPISDLPGKLSGAYVNRHWILYGINPPEKDSVCSYLLEMGIKIVASGICPIATTQIMNLKIAGKPLYLIRRGQRVASIHAIQNIIQLQNNLFHDVTLFQNF